MHLAYGVQKRDFAGETLISFLHQHLVRRVVGLLLGFVMGVAVQL